MLKFFRRIRRNLLEEDERSEVLLEQNQGEALTERTAKRSSRIRRYIIYAIGEIFLVMVGILLALQVNTWNETLKLRDLEQEILIDLRNTLIGDYPLVNMVIRGNESSKQSCEIILSHFDNNIPYHDSLAFHFEKANNWWKGHLTLRAYERAKAYGLSFIQNDSIKSLLTNIYVANHQFAENLDERETLYYYNTVVPILTYLFESTEVGLIPQPIGGKVIPFDYQQLKKDKRYRTILKTTIGNRKRIIEWMEKGIQNMELLDSKLKGIINSEQQIEK